MSEVIKTHRCPICHKIFTDGKYAPFCSKRCADIDLGRWFDGSYAVPLVEIEEPEIAELEEVIGNAESPEE